MTALQKYTSPRTWLRSLARGSVHAGVSAVMAGAGTNSLEALPIEALSKVGLDWRQMLAVFLAAAFWEALKRIQSATADPELNHRATENTEPNPQP